MELSRNLPMQKVVGSIPMSLVPKNLNLNPGNKNLQVGNTLQSKNMEGQVKSNWSSLNF